MNSLIQLKGIKKIYRSENVSVNAIRGIDLTIEEGEFVAITGPSGSGKSTLMHLLGCLDIPTEGRYLFNRMDVSVLSDDELAKIRNQKIGFVFQSFNLLPRFDALYNVQLPMIYAGIEKRKRELLAWEALEIVGLKDRARHTPSELSGGEMQRVAIARAIVMKPSIILADEPTGNLDSKTGNEIMNIFKELHSAGATIILVTHEEMIAKRTKRIISLLDGMITGDDKIN